ncbi:TfoX/Sxy family protein [Chryseolinea soli]|uniref:TfoX family protein n=1 Tax=Chryseolinea soli TaxID=2321403 RepID=A0A385SWH0_9BACT|nr:TfoX/Sxy family protein [Chryseolinea soli]AYB34906.1 TfoX family protein [Chryseolinea soli]
MAYDEHLADRIRQIFKEKKVRFEDKKMMGGLCFMVNEKMCVGVVQNELMARIDPAIYEVVLKKKYSREMDFTGRPMKGFVFISPKGIDADKDLEYWVGLCLEYNPKANSSKKRLKD